MARRSAKLGSSQHTFAAGAGFAWPHLACMVRGCSWHCRPREQRVSGSPAPLPAVQGRRCQGLHRFLPASAPWRRLGGGHRRLAGAQDVDGGTGRRGVGSGQTRAGKALGPSTVGAVPAMATGQQQRDPACRAGRRAYMGLRARWAGEGSPSRKVTLY